MGESPAKSMRLEAKLGIPYETGRMGASNIDFSRVS